MKPWTEIIIAVAVAIVAIKLLNVILGISEAKKRERKDAGK